MQRKQQTVRIRGNSDAHERAKVKKERLERALVEHCDRELAKEIVRMETHNGRRRTKIATWSGSDRLQSKVS